jgi:hypothetical protein
MGRTEYHLILQHHEFDRSGSVRESENLLWKGSFAIHPCPLSGRISVNRA